VEMWKSGKVEMWKRGNVEKWKRGNVETWNRGNAETWNRGTVGNVRRYPNAERSLDTNPSFRLLTSDFLLLSNYT
jgi:hypothetical protein